MSNTTIIERMREACDQWDASGLDCLSLGQQLAGLAEALEGLGYWVVVQAREWELALMVASEPAQFGERDLALAQLQAVVGRIRQWIAELEGA